MAILPSLVRRMKDYEEGRLLLSVVNLAVVCMNEPQFSVSLILILNHSQPRRQSLPQSSKPLTPQHSSSTINH